MLTSKQAESLLREFADQEVSALRGSVGGDILHSEIMDALPDFMNALLFLHGCRGAGATISVVAGSIPMVRVKLRCGKRTRSVSPSTWLSDILLSFGFDGRSFTRTSGFQTRLSLFMKEKLPAERILMLEAGVQNSKAAALADEHIVSGIRGKMAKKRELERIRQVKIVTDVFRAMPEGLMTEDDVLRIWREQQVIRGVLES